MRLHAVSPLNGRAREVEREIKWRKDIEGNVRRKQEQKDEGVNVC